MADPGRRGDGQGRGGLDDGEGDVVGGAGVGGVAAVANAEGLGADRAELGGGDLDGGLAGGVQVADPTRKITPKYVGPRRIVEVAVTTLATDRALLLLGVP
ncbi:ATPase, partial [Streptomyces sp. NPDC005921]